MVGPWLDYGSADHGPTWPIVKIGPTWPNLAQRQPSCVYVRGQVKSSQVNVRERNMKHLLASGDASFVGSWSFLNENRSTIYTIGD